MFPDCYEILFDEMQKGLRENVEMKLSYPALKKNYTHVPNVNVREWIHDEFSSNEGEQVLRELLQIVQFAAKCGYTEAINWINKLAHKYAQENLSDMEYWESIESEEDEWHKNKKSDSFYERKE